MKISGVSGFFDEVLRDGINLVRQILGEVSVNGFYTGSFMKWAMIVVRIRGGGSRRFNQTIRIPARRHLGCKQTGKAMSELCHTWAGALPRVRKGLGEPC